MRVLQGFREAAKLGQCLGAAAQGFGQVIPRQPTAANCLAGALDHAEGTRLQRLLDRLAAQAEKSAVLDLGFFDRHHTADELVELLHVDQQLRHVARRHLGRKGLELQAGARDTGAKTACHIGRELGVRDALRGRIGNAADAVGPLHFGVVEHLTREAGQRQRLSPHRRRRQHQRALQICRHKAHGPAGRQFGNEFRDQEAGLQRDVVLLHGIGQHGAADQRGAGVAAFDAAECGALQARRVEARQGQAQLFGFDAEPLLQGLQLSRLGEAGNAEALAQLAAKQRFPVRRADDVQAVDVAVADHQHAGGLQTLAHALKRTALAQAGGVEEEITSVQTQLHHRVVKRKRRGQHAGRTLRRPERGEHRARLHAQRLKHSHQQKRLVLAVAVAVAQHLGRRVRPVRAFTQRHRVVANFGLHPLQCLRRLLGLGRQPQQALDHRHQFGGQRRVRGEQGVGPARHVGPVLELAELQQVDRHKAARQHRLKLDRRHVALLVAKLAQAVGSARFGDAVQACRGRRGSLHPGPLQRARFRVADGHAAHLHRCLLLPGHDVRVALAEDRIGAFDRVLQLQGVAHANVGQQQGRGDEAAVDALLQLGFALQEAHGCGGGVVDEAGAAQDQNLVQQQPLVGRRKDDRDLAELTERAGIVDLPHDVMQLQRRVRDAQMGFIETHRQRSTRRHRGRQRCEIGPRRQRRTAHQCRRGDGNFLQGRFHRACATGRRLCVGAQRQPCRGHRHGHRDLDHAQEGNSQKGRQAARAVAGRGSKKPGSRQGRSRCQPGKAD